MWKLPTHRPGFHLLFQKWLIYFTKVPKLVRIFQSNTTLTVIQFKAWPSPLSIIDVIISAVLWFDQNIWLWIFHMLSQHGIVQDGFILYNIPLVSKTYLQFTIILRQDQTLFIFPGQFNLQIFCLHTYYINLLDFVSSRGKWQPGDGIMGKSKQVAICAPSCSAVQFGGRSLC